MKDQGWILTFFAIVSGISSTLLIVELMRQAKQKTSQQTPSSTGFNPFNYVANGFEGLFGAQNVSSQPTQASNTQGFLPASFNYSIKSG